MAGRRPPSDVTTKPPDWFSLLQANTRGRRHRLGKPEPVLACLSSGPLMYLLSRKLDEDGEEDVIQLCSIAVRRISHKDDSTTSRKFRKLAEIIGGSSARHLDINSTRNMMLIWGESVCRVVAIPHAEGGTPRKLLSQDVFTRNDNDPRKVLKAAWHPVSPMHIIVLADDDTFSIHRWNTTGATQTNREVSFQNISATDFALCKSGNWESLSVYLIGASSISLLCPIIPHGLTLTERSLRSMFSVASADPDRRKAEEEEYAGGLWQEYSRWLNSLKEIWEEAPASKGLSTRGKCLKANLNSQAARDVIQRAEVCPVVKPSQLISSEEDEHVSLALYCTSVCYEKSEKSSRISVLVVGVGRYAHVLVGERPIAPTFSSMRKGKSWFMKVQTISLLPRVGLCRRIVPDHYHATVLAVCSGGLVQVHLPWLLSLLGGEKDIDPAGTGKAEAHYLLKNTPGSWQDAIALEGDSGPYAILVPDEDRKESKLLCIRISNPFLQSSEATTSLQTYDDDSKRQKSLRKNQKSLINLGLLEEIEPCLEKISWKDSDSDRLDFGDSRVLKRLKEIWETFLQAFLKLRTLHQQAMAQRKVIEKKQEVQRDIHSALQNSLNTVIENQKKIDEALKIYQANAEVLLERTNAMLHRQQTGDLTTAEKKLKREVEEQKHSVRIARNEMKKVESKLERLERFSEESHSSTTKNPIELNAGQKQYISKMLKLLTAKQKKCQLMAKDLTRSDSS